MVTIMILLLAKPNSDGDELLLLVMAILVGDTSNLRIFIVNCETYNSSDAKTDGNFTFPKVYEKQHQRLVYKKYFLVLIHLKRHWIFQVPYQERYWIFCQVLCGANKLTFICPFFSHTVAN